MHQLIEKVVCLGVRLLLLHFLQILSSSSTIIIYLQTLKRLDFTIVVAVVTVVVVVAAAAATATFGFRKFVLVSIRKQKIKKKIKR